MAEVLWTRIVWNHQQGDLPLVTYQDLLMVRFMTVHVDPEPGFPAGRKGLQLAGAWSQYTKGDAKPTGMVTLDGDVAVDPGHVMQMAHAIEAEPEAVHVAPVKIWPAGTVRKSWIWAHYDETGPSQNWDVTPRIFGFNFTYLPRKLIERCLKDGMKNWTYPNCDSCFSQRAREMGLAMKVVPYCFPVHLHW
jgi:hypothetical protein